MARKPERVADYRDLADFCAKEKLALSLERGREGWTLDVHDGDDLLARATSTKGPPKVYDELALDAVLGLVKAGRFR